ncbi:MAG: PHB depolymerase family esterase [Chitinophagales bacterium]
MKIIPPVITLLLCYPVLFAQKIERVNSFGENPGNLKMYLYQPNGLDDKKNIPLIVVLHGCLQNAGIVAKQSGWNKLADQFGFMVLYPQQRMLNNPMKCFCWYQRSDLEKGKGENYSIKQMIEAVKRSYRIDSSRVFVTGLSAGAAMAVTMMADYPETFNAGAVFAGGAYKTATNIWTAMLSLYGWRIKSPDNWGQLVREQNSEYTGAYPKMIIYQGNADVVVNKRNGTQLMKQWTNLHGVSTTPTESIKRFAQVKAIEKNIYRKPDSSVAVIYYRVKHMGHALLVNPGKCENEGGKLVAFSSDKNYFSSYWTAVDFGLIELPYIQGSRQVASGTQNVTYSVPLVEGAMYEWRYPKDCKAIGNTNTNSITLNFGKRGGNIDVTRVISSTCKQLYPTLNVVVGNK